MQRRTDEYRARQRAYDRRRNKTAARRRTRTLSLYGITPEIVEQTKKKQGGKCAVCRRPPNHWHIDHCHRTKKFRAMLCASCNTFLGRIESDPKRVPKALKYLEKHK